MKQYKILELTTQGWTLANDNYVKLSKEKCKFYLEKLMAEGQNPDALKVIIDND
jgi:hypothetical protein